MPGEKNLKNLLKDLSPVLNEGEYVFSTINTVDHINRVHILFEFKEPEGITLITTKSHADKYRLNYNFVAAWITLKVYSSLEAVGLTAVFSSALAKQNISCNVIAGYYHDHIFVHINDANRAMQVLKDLKNQKT